MAVVDVQLVRRGLRERLLTSASVAAADVAPENRNFDPPNPPSNWIREIMIIDSERLVAFGQLEGRGRVRYDVVVPKRSGTDNAEAISKSIIEVFVPGNPIQFGGINVSIDRSERGQGREEIGTDGKVWWFIPVFVSWRTYAAT
jgi:hypothetical protein